MRLAAIISLILITYAVPVRAQSPASGYAERAALRPPLGPDAVGEALYANARRALNQGAYDEAISGFTRVATRYPLAYVAPNAWYWLAYTLHRRGLENGSSDDLRRARDAVIVHRVFYEDALTRTDAMGLGRAVVADLTAMGEARAADREVTRSLVSSSYTPCDGRVAAERPLSSELEDLRELPMMDAVRGLDEIVNGEGLCLDVTGTAGLYDQAGLTNEAKAIIIAAYGRSLHPSAAERLREIERTESDAVLQALARAWLQFR